MAREPHRARVQSRSRTGVPAHHWLPADRRREHATKPANSGSMNAIWAISIVVLKEMIRRKDFYVLFVITALITLVMGSVSIFNDQSIAGYLKELALLLIWICSLVIAISTTARQLYSEKENRTIFPLLAKPVSRSQLLLGKFFGCWIATGLALFVFYLFL